MPAGAEFVVGCSPDSTGTRNPWGVDGELEEAPTLRADYEDGTPSSDTGIGFTTYCPHSIGVTTSVPRTGRFALRSHLQYGEAPSAFLTTRPSGGWRLRINSDGNRCSTPGSVRKTNPGRQYASRSGPNSLNDDDTTFGYLKWGIYKPAWSSGPTNVPSRSVFHDNVAVGASFGEVDPSVP